MTKKALYAGSFDPMTYGHLDIIVRASKICDELTVGVIYNLYKEPFFTLEERVNTIKETVSHITNVSVDSFSGLLANYVNENKFDIVVRGLRATTDFEYEIQMAQVNAGLYSGNTETIFLMTNPKYSFISSSAVRELYAFNADISKYVPQTVMRYMKEKTIREEKR